MALAFAGDKKYAVHEDEPVTFASVQHYFTKSNALSSFNMHKYGFVTAGAGNFKALKQEMNEIWERKLREKLSKEVGFRTVT